MTTWSNIDTAQTNSWGLVPTVEQLQIDAADTFGGAAFAEVAFAGEQTTVNNVGGNWAVIDTN